MRGHFAKFIILHSKINNRAVDRPMVKIFSDKNKATFQNLLSTINWENELSDKNGNEAMIIFNQNLAIAYNTSFPFANLSRKRSKDIPLISTGHRQGIKQKYLLY